MLFEFECDKLQAKGCPLSIEPLSTIYSGHSLRNTYKTVQSMHFGDKIHTCGYYYWLEDLLPSCADSWKIDQQLECCLAPNHHSVQSSLVVVVVGFSSWSQTTLLPFKLEFPLKVSARNWTQGHHFHMSRNINPTSRSTNFILQFEAYNENRQISQDDQSCQRCCDGDDDDNDSFASTRASLIQNLQIE